MPRRLDGIMEYAHSSNEEFSRFLTRLHKNKFTPQHYIITIRDKIGHPWADRITGSNCFAINGGKGVTLRLHRGQRYFFTFKSPITHDQPDHELFFTTDPIGGSVNPQNQENFTPTELDGTPDSYGQFKTVSFVIKDNFPRLFYYQDKKNPFLGGPIIVEGSQNFSLSSKKSTESDPFEVLPKDLRERVNNPNKNPHKKSHRPTKENSKPRKSSSREKPRRDKSGKPIIRTHNSQHSHYYTRSLGSSRSPRKKYRYYPYEKNRKYPERPRRSERKKSGTPMRSSPPRRRPRSERRSERTPSPPRLERRRSRTPSPRKSRPNPSSKRKLDPSDRTPSLILRRRPRERSERRSEITPSPPRSERRSERTPMRSSPFPSRRSRTPSRRSRTPSRRSRTPSPPRLEKSPRSRASRRSERKFYHDQRPELYSSEKSPRSKREENPIREKLRRHKGSKNLGPPERKEHEKNHRPHRSHRHHRPHRPYRHTSDQLREYGDNSWNRERAERDRHSGYIAPEDCYADFESMEHGFDYENIPGEYQEGFINIQNEDQWY